jgi:hypothetical protein
MLSDAMHDMDWEKEGKMLDIMAIGCLTNHHAKQFCAFAQRIRNRCALSAIIDGKQGCRERQRIGMRFTSWRKASGRS